LLINSFPIHSRLCSLLYLTIVVVASDVNVKQQSKVRFWKEFDIFIQLTFTQYYFMIALLTFICEHRRRRERVNFMGELCVLLWHSLLSIVTIALIWNYNFLSPCACVLWISNFNFIVFYYYCVMCVCIWIINCVCATLPCEMYRNFISNICSPNFKLPSQAAADDFISYKFILSRIKCECEGKGNNVAVFVMIQFKSTLSFLFIAMCLYSMCYSAVVVISSQFFIFIAVLTNWSSCKHFRHAQKST
jgi:hypothetical protein